MLGRPRTCTFGDIFEAMPAADRRYKLADVTAESRAGWRQFCRFYGANPTVLAEVMGVWLGQFEPPEKLPKWLRDLVEEARDLEVERSRRPQSDDE